MPPAKPIPRSCTRGTTRRRTLESRLVARGSHLLGRYASQTGIPVERTGALLVAWTVEERDALADLRQKAVDNGCNECRIIDADEVYRQVPDLGPGVLGALTVPDESITCPWTATLALATEAQMRGTELRFEHPVKGVVVGDEMAVLSGPAGEVRARFVVNAAGLNADTVDGLFGHRRFTVTARRGELLVFDKLARPLASRIVLAVPSSLGKGVLISPTIYGNSRPRVHGGEPHEQDQHRNLRRQASNSSWKRVESSCR